MRVVPLSEIKTKLHLPTIISMQEVGFLLFSEGRVQVPSVGHVKIIHTPVRYHIKSGSINGDELFVVKLAGGLEESSIEFGKAESEGMMLVFSSKNGKPLYLLQDNGYLTNIRTAVAGLLAAKYLAPNELTSIGILGTGIQAKMQIEMIKYHTECRNLSVWGRSISRVLSYKRAMEKEGFFVKVCESPAEVAKASQLLITTTASKQALIELDDVSKGMHITAVGADSPGKQELDPKIFQKADIVAVDSRKQCVEHGEISHLYRSCLAYEERWLELGEIIADPSLGRTSKEQITVIDLTGVAIQDIQIAKAVIASLSD